MKCSCNTYTQGDENGIAGKSSNDSSLCMKKIPIIWKILAVALGAIIVAIVSTSLDYFFFNNRNWLANAISSFIVGGLGSLVVVQLLPLKFSPKEEKNNANREKVMTTKKIFSMIFGGIVFMIVSIGLDILIFHKPNGQKLGTIAFFIGVFTSFVVSQLPPRVVPPKEEKK
ncbi:MAG: hypothetical protein LBT25_04125 [Candidatus Symbiothrix sp.]|jgi:hypothetical protein|nr:hypothetical protein [Candidatus Symbiothrix sp.]